MHYFGTELGNISCYVQLSHLTIDNGYNCKFSYPLYFNCARIFFDNTLLSSATGFFLKRNAQWFVITNWHVVAGRRTDTGQPLNPHGAIPNVCEFLCGELTDEAMLWKSWKVPLGDAFEGRASWYQHPVRGQDADIAALPVSAEAVGISKDLLSDDGHDPDMFVDLGGEVFLPGYPLGLTGGGGFPIWKRASLASSLEWGPGVHTQFLVDTASREGMSGSPCLAISNWQHYRLRRETGKMEVVHQPLSWRLMGVYSGRLNAKDDLGAQLGIVWRDKLIFETVDAKVPGRVILNQPN